ncbi:MAG: tRNA adenosine(34) deaminase TadA [Candidatus Aminicenantes bacterium]|nr:tRNA adenosine(34) deaminase TadA [Candidatus Aminicenantes bacterium]
MKAKSKEFFMKKAVEQAERAYENDEVPVGAVVVLDNEVIGSAGNSVIKESDPCAHAEIAALRAAAKKLKNYRLTGSDIYVTLEPCLMCYSALVHARVKTLYFGAFDKKTGVYSSGAFDRLPPVFNHDIGVEPGVLQEESSRILKKFFKERRGAGAVERDGLENR